MGYGSSAPGLQDGFSLTLFASASREFQLVAACSAWPPNRSRIDALLAEPVLWEEVLHLTERHRVAGLVNAALASLLDVPAAMRANLARRAARMASANLISVAMAGRIANALGDAHIPFVVLKGAALSQLAFGNTRLRHSRDIDVLLGASYLEKAELLLEELGFRRASSSGRLPTKQTEQWTRYRKHFEFIHTATGVRLEVHWRAFDNMRLAGISLEERHWVSLGGGIRLPTLPTPELLMYLCLHGAGHAWFRLKWIADVAALLQTEGAPSHGELLRSSRKCGLDRPVEQALLLCAALFDVQPGLPNKQVNTQQAVAAMPATKTVQWLTRAARDALLTRSTASVSAEADFVPRRLAASRLLLRRGWPYRLEELRVQAASPADWQTLQLPAWLSRAYPLLRVPLWIKRRWFPSRLEARRSQPAETDATAKRTEAAAQC